MKHVQYVPLQASLVDLYTIVKEEDVDFNTVLEWASDAMEAIQVKQTWQETLTFLEVDNYKFCLPKGTKYIDQIFYKEKFTDDDVLAVKLYTGDETTITSKFWEFYNSSYIQNWKALRMSSTPFNRLVHCANKPDDFNPIDYCEHQYSVEKDGMVTTSFKKGFVCLSYLRYPQNEAGDFLIPDDRDVKQAIRYYILSHFWEMRTNTKEEGSMKMWERYLQLWELTAAKTRGKMLMLGKDGLENFKQQVYRIGPHSNTYYQGFGNLSVQENIKLY
jgi:hypothetical protein